jgi:hypothetical protein
LKYNGIYGACGFYKSPHKKKVKKSKRNQKEIIKGEGRGEKR